MKTIPIVLLGFGNVAQSLLQLLEKNDRYEGEGVVVEVRAIFDRGGGIVVGSRKAGTLVDIKRREGSVTRVPGVDRLSVEEALDSAGAGSILVDTSVTDASTGEPGLTPARLALARGISVVFASKGPLVVAQSELVARAREKGVRLGASAAVGIPLPSIEVGVYGCRGARVHRFRGILNDTTNQILRDLEAGITLESSIERARIAGTIEEDPRLDLEGWDAAYKLLILARALWEPGLSLSDAHTSGVEIVDAERLEEARRQRQRLRLVASGERDGAGGVLLETSVQALDQDDPFYHLGPGHKAVVLETDVMGSLTVSSTRGGPLATAACVVKDVLNIASRPSPF
ncbi:MAG TPA: hypothetical protein VEK15_31785 [Vicinamibacteria bacterium]|nr:hypothetical protein [Vicinamibacteria bacterium]